jgi:hypothetical protein
MNSLVVITRPGTYDDVLREYDPAAAEVLYDDPLVPGAGAVAGVTSTGSGQSLSLGDEVQYYASIQVYIPQESPSKNVRVDDVVLVVTGPDNDIDGRLFRVTNVPVGGRLFSSIGMLCTGIAPSKQWST